MSIIVTYYHSVNNGNDYLLSFYLSTGAYRDQQYMFWFGPMIGAAITALLYGMIVILIIYSTDE